MDKNQGKAPKTGIVAKKLTNWSTPCGMVSEFHAKKRDNAIVTLEICSTEPGYSG